jgi:O-antigen/teichoic acid export membrane protein
LGIIKQQSIQSTLFVYIGVFIGFFNAALLMPNLLTPEQKGLLDFVNSLSSIFASICVLGLPFVTLKYFPGFRDHSTSHNSYFTIIFIITIIGFLIGTLVFLTTQDWLIGAKNTAKSFPNFMVFFIMVFTAQLVFINFDPYIRALYNVVLGILLENVFVKGFILLTLLLFAVKKFDFQYVFFLYCLGLSLPGIIIAFYLLLKVDFRFHLDTFHQKAKGLYGEMRSVAFYGLLGSLGSIVVMNIDRIMLGNMNGLEATGIYSTAFFFGLFIVKPSIGLRRVSGVVISDAWKNNDMKAIQEVYYKSCLNQLILSIYLFLAIWLSIDFMYELIRPEYAVGKYVVLFIGFAQVIEMATGTNYEVLVTSKYYKYNAYFLVLLFTLVIALNYMLIPKYGINGAAFASLVAMALNNLLRFLFLYWKFKLQPFNLKFLVVIAIGLAIFALMTFIVPSIPNEDQNKLFSVGNAVLFSTLITILFWPIIYFLKISPEINLMVDKTVKRFIVK